MYKKCAIKLNTSSKCTEAEINIIIFGCSVAGKQRKAEEVTFLENDFWNF